MSVRQESPRPLSQQAHAHMHTHTRAHLRLLVCSTRTAIQYLRNTGCSQDILEFLTVTLGAEGALTKTPSRRRRREDGDAGDADESISPPSRRALHSVQSLLQPETSSSSSSTLNATPKPSLPLLNLTTATSSSSSSKASARKSMRTTFRIGSLSIDIEQLYDHARCSNSTRAGGWEPGIEYLLTLEMGASQ